jgi:hypothetical protein
MSQRRKRLAAAQTARMAATAERVRDRPVTIVIIPQNLSNNQMKLAKMRLGSSAEIQFFNQIGSSTGYAGEEVESAASRSGPDKQVAWPNGADSRKRFRCTVSGAGIHDSLAPLLHKLVRDSLGFKGLFSLIIGKSSGCIQFFT